MAYPQPQGSASPYAAPMAASGSPSDIAGVDHLKIGSVLGLLFQAMVWIGAGIFYLIFTALSNTTTTFGTTATTLPSWITVNTLYVAFGLLAGGFVLGMIAYIFFYLGLREVKRGAPDFGAPTTLVLIGLIGFIMVALGLILIVGGILSALNDAVNGTIASGGAAIGLGAILGGLALLGIGAILALIGVIGLVLGNWRAGTRYGESTLKIGAIMTILPYVSIVGYILLLVGYMSAAKKLRTGWVPAGPVTYGYGAPPNQPPQTWQAPPPPPR